MTQSIKEQIRTLPAIETELHLFEVGREMLGANPMPRPHDAALQKRECRFDGIGVNVAHDIHAGTVVNFFVVSPLGFSHGGLVCGCIIGENDFHVLTDILADVFCECPALRISGMEEAEIAVALADAHHYFFVVHASDAALTFVPSADVSDIHLDLAIQHRFIGLRHGVADAMAKIPRGLVAHSDRTLNLTSGHSLLRLAEKVRSQKPLGQRQVRIVERSAGSDGKLIVTVFAVEELPFGFQFDHWPFAAQAARPFREAQANEQSAALLFGWEQCVYIN